MVFQKRGKCLKTGFAAVPDENWSVHRVDQLPGSERGDCVRGEAAKGNEGIVRGAVFVVCCFCLVQY